jgi:hypothetical protein
MRRIDLKGEVNMNEDNKKLLEEVINDRLKKSLGENPDEAAAAFEEAMKAIDRQNELDKTKNDLDGIKNERDSKNRDRLVKVVEIGAVVVAAPLIEAACKKGFAYMICEFEKDYSFTTMAGKSLSSLFKFKK